MEIRDLTGALLRRWPVILVTTLAAAVMAYVKFESSPLIYKAEADVRVYTATVGDSSWTEFNLQYSDRLINTYVAILTSDAVRQELEAAVQGTPTAAAATLPLPELEVAVVPNTELLSISAESTNPVLAASVVNSAAEMLQARTLPTLAASANEPVGEAEALSRTLIRILNRASVPSEPSGPGLGLVVALVAVAGVIVGAVLALISHAMDPRLHDEVAIVAAAGLPLLGVIPRIDRRHRARPFDLTSPVVSEAFRRLQLHVDAVVRRVRISSDMAGRHRSTVLLVVGVQPGDGATTVASHLAVTAAESGARVLLVDMNLRLPMIGRLFQVQGLRGISDVLAGKSEFDQVVKRSVIANLDVVASGSTAVGQPLLLNGTMCPNLLEPMRERYDLIILDVASFPAVTDAALMAPLVDGVLLVARCGSTLRRALHDTVAQWETLGTKVIGVVANSTPNLRRNAQSRLHYGASLRSYGTRPRRQGSRQKRDIDPLTRPNTVTVED